MDLIKGLLFESPVLVGAICAFVSLVLLIRWRRTGSPGRRKAFVATVLVSAVLLLLQGAVVTDRERIIGLMQELAEAVERADVPRIEQSIDEQYGDRRGNRDVLLARIRDRLTRNTVQGASLSAFDVRTDGDQATVSFRVTCELRDRDNAFGITASRWEVDLARRREGWMVRAIRLLQLGPLKAGDVGGAVDW